MTWKRTDEVFAKQVEKASAKAALRLWNKIEQQADVTFASAAWLMERRWPELFSRPEVQLNLIQQNNVMGNTLSITISPEEARQLNADAEPIRQSVREMFAGYKPVLKGNGNGERSTLGVDRTVDVEARPVTAEALAPIERKEGEEKSSAFWALFASGTGERLVEKSTAIFVAKVIVDETVGRGLGNQVVVAFKSEAITVSDVLAVIDRLCGGPAGWQHLQRKARVAGS
jgi:hypothetical protein